MCWMTFFLSMPCRRHTFWVISAAILEMSLDFPSSLWMRLQWNKKEWCEYQGGTKTQFSPLFSCPKHQNHIRKIALTHFLWVLATFFSHATLLVFASASYLNFSCVNKFIRKRNKLGSKENSTDYIKNGNTQLCPPLTLTVFVRLTSFIALSKSGLCGALGGIQRWPQSFSEVMNTPTACCSSLVRLSLWSCSISNRYSDNFGPC